MVFLEGNLEWKGQISRLFENFLATYQDDVRQVGQGNLSPAAAMAALKPIIQANLDDLLGQN